MGILGWLVGPLDEIFLTIAEFCTGALSAAFHLMDAGPIEIKPFEGVIGKMTSIGVTLALVMALVQVGRSMIQVGGGFGRLAIGLVEYTFAVVGGIAILELATDASISLTEGIIDAGTPGAADGTGGPGGWAGLAEQLDTAVDDGANPLALALAGLMFNLPAAVLYMLLFLALQFVLPLGACVIVIAAAGRLSEFGRAWLPMLARLLGTAALAPLGSALVLIIGIALQVGAASIDVAPAGAPAEPVPPPPAGAAAEDNDDPEALIGLLLGGIIVLLSPFAFVVIYRMLGFTDRGSGSGGSGQASGGSSKTSFSDANAGGTSGLAAAGSTAERRFADTLASLPRVGGRSLTGGLAAVGGSLSRAGDGLTATRSREAGGHSTRSIEPGSAGGSDGVSSGGTSSMAISGGHDGAATPTGEFSVATMYRIREFPKVRAPQVAGGKQSDYDLAG